MVMKKKLLIQKDGKQFELNVYPMTIQPIQGNTDFSPWYERLEGLNFVEDAPNHSTNPENLDHRDLVFQHTDGNYYIVAQADSKDFKQDISLAVSEMGNEVRGKIAVVNPSYFRRYAQQNRLLRRAPAVIDIVVENDNGIRQIDPHQHEYKPGSWVTGSPALVGAMTLASFAGQKAMAGLDVPARNFGFKLGNAYFDMGFMTNGLFTSLAVMPLTAALAAFSMNYTANWVAYKLENKGRPLDQAAKDSIWKDSVHKSMQMGASFFMLAGVRETLEHALGQSLKSAWGGVHAIGGNICPSEVRAAMMLSMSLAFGVAMATTTLMWNLWHGQSGKESFKQAGMALVAGLFAGAVASVDFGNSGLSFFATWVSLSVVPTAKLATHEGRDEVKQSAKDMGTSAKAVFKYMGKCMPTCEIEDFAIDPAHLGGGAPGMPPM